MGVSVLVFTVLALCACCAVSSEKNVVCYYGTWATYRWGNGKFDVDDVNPTLCTHLVYAFVGIDHQGNVISLDSFLDLPDNYGKDNFGKFNALKQRNPKLKTLLAVGGWNEGSGKYSIMAADANLRKNFISSALNMVQTHGFDGFDLDWEYPNRRDTVNGQADVDNFTKLVKELKEEFSKHGLQVTAAVASVGEKAGLSYDVEAICQYLDIVNLMTYDFYGAWDAVTGHNAGLHKGEGDGAAARESLFTVDVAVEYWLAKGCPPEKLVIGLPFYGRSFKLANANVNGVRAASSGAGIAGPFTVTAGTVGYNEFCNILKTEPGWEVRYDELAEVPYAVNGDNWVSYDDANSLTKKIEWGLTKNVSGMMLWSIETDDFHGICGEDYPLLRAINRALGREVDGNEVVVTTEGVTASVATSEAASSEAATSVTTEISSTEAAATTNNPGTETPTSEATSSETATSVTNETASTEAGTEATSTEAAVTIMPGTETEVTTTDSLASELTTSAPETESTTGDLGSVCVVEGITANPFDCSKFLICIRNVNGVLYPVEFDCPPELHFDPDDLYCNYAYKVECTA